MTSVIIAATAVIVLGVPVALLFPNYKPQYRVYYAGCRLLSPALAS